MASLHLTHHSTCLLGTRCAWCTLQPLLCKSRRMSPVVVGSEACKRQHDVACSYVRSLECSKKCMQVPACILEHPGGRGRVIESDANRWDPQNSKTAVCCVVAR